MKNVLTLVFLLFFAIPAFSAYHHAENTDSDIVLETYPELAGTKLDSCALCHNGGAYEKKPGVVVELGSCQWCHYSYGYDKSGDINDTINNFGSSYLVKGKNSAALIAIEQEDSDGDGYSNIDEIGARRFPGNASDDPSKVTAPYQVISLEDLESMDYHSQIMLMNTHKSGDFYAEYGGVTMSDILDYSGILTSATGITVYAPDGWAQYHPLEEDSDPLMYHVYGEYPQAPYYYIEEADEARNTENGWCNYASPALSDLVPNEPIVVDNGLRMILAYSRDEAELTPGTLNDDNKLDGEGPFRVVPPQKLVGPPDQSLKSDAQDVAWPFDEDADHNAGFASRSATIIKVDPLPEGTTDIDTLEAGWNFVDEKKIVVYGAIDPFYTVWDKLVEIKQLVRAMDKDDFKKYQHKRNTLQKIRQAQKMLRKGKNNAFNNKLAHLSLRLDGCSTGDSPDNNDWITDCESQKAVYWAIHEMTVLMGK